MSLKSRNLLILFIITLLLFCIYFLRSSQVPFIGIDSYYFLNYIFSGTALHVTGVVGTFLMSLIPTNIYWIKLIMFVVTLVTMYVAYKCAELYDSKHALVYPLSLLAFIFFSLIFFKFEDDLFALPFLFSSLYFIIKYQISTKPKKLFDRNIILSILFLIISISIWKYTVFFILAYLFISNFNWIYILASSSLFLFYQELIGSIIPNNLVAENMMAFFSGRVAGGVIFLLFFLYLKKSMITKNKYAIYFFSILTLLNFKFIYILTPILLLNNINLLKNITLDKHKVIYFIWFVFLIGTINQIIISPPSYSDYELLGIAQSTAIDLNKEIDYSWGIGYYAIYQNIDVNNFGTTPITEIDYSNKIIVAEKNNPIYSSCKKIKKGKWFEIINCP